MIGNTYENFLVIGDFNTTPENKNMIFWIRILPRIFNEQTSLFQISNALLYWPNSNQSEIPFYETRKFWPVWFP